MLETSARLLAPAVPAPGAAGLAGPRPRRAAGSQRPHGAQRRRPPALARLPGAGHHRGRPGATAWGPGRPCPRCCWTTTRRWPSPSGCARPPGAAWPGSRRPPCAPWPSWRRCSPPACAAASPPCRRTTVPVPDDGPTVDPAVLTPLAGACRDQRAAALRLPDATPAAARRRSVEPHRLVSWARRWYLVAWDAGARDWRTFRVDRLRPLLPVGPRFVPRAAAGGGPGRLRLPGRGRRRLGLPGAGAAPRPGRRLSERLWPVYGVLEPPATSAPATLTSARRRSPLWRC